MRVAVVLVLLSNVAFAQTINLSEVRDGVHQTTIDFKLSGKMKLDRAGGVEAVPLEATARHVYTEGWMGPSRGARHYEDATSTTVSGVERGVRSLAAERRSIVVDRKDGRFTPWSPQGLLTTDDLALTAEHFDTLRLRGLLPDKETAVNATWTINDDIVAAVCQFDGVLSQTLTGKLVSADAAAAKFTVEGNAEGVERGAKAKLKITGEGVFDIASRSITKLEWKQTDDRDAGPVSPAMEATVSIAITRTALKSWTRDFKDGPSASDGLTDVHYTHPANAYTLHHDRDWHAVVQSDTHLVLRRVVKGELIAQATIAPWPAVKPMQTAEENQKAFVEASAKTPGWQPEKVLEEGRVTQSKNASVFRRVVAGKQDGVSVVQSFALVTHESGKQVVIACVCRPEMAEKLAAGDATLADAVAFPAK